MNRIFALTAPPIIGVLMTASLQAQATVAFETVDLPGEPVVALARVIEDTPGVKLRGLMTWEGHNLGYTDRAEKEAGIRTSIGQLLESAEACRSEGIAIEIVSGGGSGTYMVTAKIKGMTEVQAGGAIFCDQSYQQ